MASGSYQGTRVPLLSGKLLIKNILENVLFYVKVLILPYCQTVIKYACSYSPTTHAHIRHTNG